jgi:hypothetical protein
MDELPDELLEHVLSFLVEEDAALSTKQGYALIQVCHLWYDSCSRIPGFWSFVIGHVKQVSGPFRMGEVRTQLWTNQVILGTPACCDCLVRELDITITQLFSIERLEVDRSLIFLATFEKQGEEPKFTCIQKVSIGDRLSEMDGEEWRRITIHIDGLNVELKKGQYAGLVYDTTHGFTSEEQKFFPHIPTEMIGGEKEWLQWFDRDLDNVMCGPKPKTSTGFAFSLVGILPPLNKK